MALEGVTERPPDPSTSLSSSESEVGDRALWQRNTSEEKPLVRRLPIFRIVVVLVVVAGVLLGWDLTRASAAPYRTAVVGTNTVTATLDSVGTVTPSNQASLNFNVSGTVATVDVSVGQSVTAGEVLATLDTTSLEATVVSDQASLASAQAKLASDESGQTSSASSKGGSSGGSSDSSSSDVLTATFTGPGSGGSPGSGSGGSSGGSSNSGSQNIQTLQAAVVAAQQKLDSDTAAAAAELKEATEICTKSSTGGTAGGTSDPSTSTSSTTAGGSGTSSACEAALNQAAAAQALVASDVKALEAAESALTSALQASSSSKGGSSSSGSGGSGSIPSGGSGKQSSTSPSAGSEGRSGSGAPSGSATAGSGSQATTTHAVTAQQLALDQANIDVAQANLTNAQQSLSDATMVSTISGTVGSLTIAVGDSVSAGGSSSTPSIVIVGPGSEYVVTADVPVANVGKVAVGQSAVVTPDATSEVLDGRVTSIGVATTSDTSTDYPVTISVNSNALGQLSGSEAEVAIVTASEKDVTSVPSSAVRAIGSLHTVTVLANGTTKTEIVTVGITGSIWTQITSGISRGQEVVLADNNEPVPSSSTSSTSTGGFSRLGGAGGGITIGGGAGGGVPSGISFPGATGA